MTIGNIPIVDTLLLVPGQDLLHEIQPAIGDSIPPATTVDLVIYDINATVVATWTAQVSTQAARWNVASELTDTIPIPATFRIYVRYSDGVDQCWFRGHVTREE
ncbi:DUF7264 domain-containing protein [Nocardia otitidiscaviarum]|uniref:LtfC-like domain-containing protein n=1 Tax=Nocardia otitidiscaviarum TaxID=1823 RepID=UPI002458E8FE|nr:hypothetical protein [Nocardia otitidiscaviarum]